jgi:hypothetical protein
MANRGITGALLSAIDEQIVVYYELFEITTVQSGSNVVYYLTNGPQDIEHAGNTYRAFGQFVGMGPVNENATQEIAQMAINISGIQPYEANAVNPNESFMQTIIKDSTVYVDQPVKVYRSFYGLDNLQIGAFLLFEGQIVSAAIEYDVESTATVELKVSSHWVNFQRYTGRFTNTNSQQTYYSGDTGFDRANRVQKDIIWQQPPE